ncbi:MAG TPA: DUF2628 domain-containing protein [Methyloceanibacter sp.]|nr:DUF2628 domain-containing protein [Methyloceanibacter sp.]
MTLYSVYEPPGEARDPEERAEALVFVKDGFSWPALFVPGLWLLYQRMWLELVLFVALFALLGWVFGPSDQAQTVLGLLSVAIIVLFAFEANDLRGAALERQGYTQIGTAIGTRRDAAEAAFFQSWLPQQGKARERQPPPERPGSAGIPAPKASGEAEGVIGLFPAP